MRTDAELIKSLGTDAEAAKVLSAAVGRSLTDEGIRKWREAGNDAGMHFFKNLPVSTYVRLMARASALVGNSSSGIREGAYIGTPVVDIGTRQTARERGANVRTVPQDRDAILDALN